MSKTIRELKSNLSGSYGVIGKSTEVFASGGRLLRVGDVVAYRFKNMADEAIYKGFIVEHNGKFSVMGSVGTGLETHSYITLVIPFEVATLDMYKAMHHNIRIDEKTVKKMTLSQIEKKLGYPIEIVEGK